MKDLVSQVCEYIVDMVGQTQSNKDMSALQKDDLKTLVMENIWSLPNIAQGLVGQYQIQPVPITLHTEKEDSETSRSHKEGRVVEIKAKKRIKKTKKALKKSPF